MFRYVIFSAIGLNALVVLDILFSKNVNILEIMLAISMSALLILVYSLITWQKLSCEISCDMSKSLYNMQCDLLKEIKEIRKLLEEKGDIKNE